MRVWRLSVDVISNPIKGKWNVAKNIEGLISRRGVHASGIILTNDKFTELGATMKSPKGVKCSQWELHDEEYVGHIKYDFLTIEKVSKFFYYASNSMPPNSILELIINKLQIKKTSKPIPLKQYIKIILRNMKIIQYLNFKE